jgi:hypothetical protein
LTAIPARVQDHVVPRHWARSDCINHTIGESKTMRTLATMLLGVSLISFSGCAEQSGTKDDKKAEKKGDDKKEEKKEEKEE